MNRNATENTVVALKRMVLSKQNTCPRDTLASVSGNYAVTTQRCQLNSSELDPAKAPLQPAPEESDRPPYAGDQTNAALALAQRRDQYFDRSEYGIDIPTEG